MGYLKLLSNSPLALLLCVLAGSCVGWLLPVWGSQALIFGQVYLALINMAALPLMVVATFFGLRKTLLLPRPALRMLMILALAAGLVLVSALLGTLVGLLTGAGLNLDRATREVLGMMVQTAGGEASNTAVALYGSSATVQIQEASPWSGVIPDNFFRVLSQGQLLGIFMGTLIFGLAFAALLKSQSQALMGIFEAIYRASEVIIARVNVFIPVLAFSMAAYVAASMDGQTLQAMRSFLTSFVVFSFIFCGLAIGFIWKRSGLSLDLVLSALKTPVLISLTSASASASIPDTIHAMSSKLGFSRGVAELVVPMASVFMRAGNAFYFAMLAVFVANIYGHTIAPQDFLLICLGASLAAFASAANNKLVVVGFAGIVLTMLNLPIQAALVLFLAIDLLCEGLRNLLSLLLACVLIVLVSRGLPSDRETSVQAFNIKRLGPVNFVFSRASVGIIFACTLVLAMLITLAGIGFGMRNTVGTPTGAQSSGNLPSTGKTTPRP
jgi:Na+/H+-dicarboxylate symporter